MGDSSAPRGTMTDTATGTCVTGDSCAAILSLATDLKTRIGDSRVGAAATSPLAEADFFLAAATLAGCVEPTATLPRPHLASATLGGMKERRRQPRESLDTCEGRTSLDRRRLPQWDCSSPAKKGCVSAHPRIRFLCVPKKTPRNIPPHKRHHPKKNVRDCSSVYLCICFRANKITALGSPPPA